ncbi:MULTISPECIES: VTT domain-containing protein [Paraburkholderia]|jgi:membrane protein DedA with SNARE-associated domain|uniref:Membrane protein n=1 Tax=Paraburkholderia largidicola TaxID=3014751 RepID=A0A7I8BTS0_9BURK|nr:MULTISPECIES: VTT domain-containing protein [Paraburkholderia]BCF91370.1 membrane protein [Paraburkholderia sp. PGU16]BEU25168.1 VTT domain-containing protein [Paraburkholderia sp. 22B1P]GJH37672.1 VTT domain-containing protein [Paraburkholderia hospita]CAG9257635.1 Undecaprenyl-diphosphatase [Paraburkholderia caribensis]
MEHAYVQLLHLLAGHTAWTLVVVFLAAFLEAVAIIGTFVPGSTAMFIAGALVGTGTLNLGWLFASAIVGAVAGDGMSYWFGRRYKDTISKLWPFSTHPGLLESGQKYFDKHGAKSVVFARFAAPLRAIVPVVAGMLEMPPMRFYAMNVLSALLWAPAHILPGVVFGASIQLAGAVSFRLVAALAIVAAIVWVCFWVMRVVVSHARAWAGASRSGLVKWARDHEAPYGKLVYRIVDPERAAIGLLVGISVFVLVCAGIFFGVMQDVVSGDPLVQVDMSFYRFLQSAQAPWIGEALARASTLGSVPTLAALVIASTIMIAFEKRWRMLIYWLIAVIFSQVLIFAIQVIVPHAPPAAAPSDLYAFPSNHVAASVTVYGFLAFVVARRVGMLTGIAVTALASLIVIAVAFAGLYSGRFAFSDAVGGAAFAAVWVAVVALTAVWRHPEAPPAREYMPAVLLIVLCASVGLQIALGRQPDAEPQVRQRPPVVVTQAQWTDSLWKQFPCYRSDMKGDRREPITVQWTADRQQIVAQLRSRGWLEGTRFNARSLFSLVSPDVPVMDLPVLPKLNDGEPSTLVFSRQRARSDERDVLRFWRTGYAVARRNGMTPAPIWLGSLVHERLLRPSWPFNVLRTDRQLDPLISPKSVSGEWRELELSSSMGCTDIPVTLIASTER